MSKKRGEEERMKEEDNMLKRVGRENSFKVPEGYLEDLTSEVMGKLSEKEEPASGEAKQPTMRARVRPLSYMATMFIGAALIVHVASPNRRPATVDDQLAAGDAGTEVALDKYIGIALDRSILDDYPLYVYFNDVTAEQVN